MADVRPFRGVRYATTPLGEALCPPYDVIDAALAARLRGRPRNAVFLELPEGEGEERYQRASRVWNEWTSDGTLRRDEKPAFYVIEERYRLGGRARVRRG